MSGCGSFAVLEVEHVLMFLYSAAFSLSYIRSITWFSSFALDEKKISAARSKKISAVKF